MTRSQKKPAAKSSKAVTINVIVASQAWTGALRTAAAVCRRAAQAALEGTALEGVALQALTSAQPLELSVLLTTDTAVRKLNAVYRGKDKATNVLSFLATPDDGFPDGGFPAGVPLMLGDIAVAYDVTAREAKIEGKILAAHLSHLVVHGVLHLLGYDHEHEKDAVTMERRERNILAGLGISDPYALPPAAPRRKLRKPPRGSR